MYSEKLSVSLPHSLAQFVEEYKVTHRCKTRSEVLERAVMLLRERELESAYRHANDDNDTARDFDSTSGDGLPDETW